MSRDQLIKKVLHEGLNLPKLSPQSWFQSILNRTTGPYTLPNYSDSLFYKLGNDVIFEYDRETKNFWVEYSKIWSVFEIQFGLNYRQIQGLIKPMVEKHYNLESVTPLCSSDISRSFGGKTLQFGIPR